MGGSQPLLDREGLTRGTVRQAFLANGPLSRGGSSVGAIHVTEAISGRPVISALTSFP